MIDDSGLFHGTYDPQKAHEYYLRNRKLKGRKPAAAAVATSPARGGRPAVGANRSKTQSRQAELKAQKEHLEKRLERLREVLAQLVDAAKKRSGGDPNHKDKAPETPADKADRNKAAKKAKPETAAQKKERAKKAKETYEKEHPNSLSRDVDILQAQVADIHKKIQDAMAAAQERRKKAGIAAAKSGSQNNNDGPRGR